MTAPANPTPEPDGDEPLYRHCAGCNEHLTLRDGCEWNEDPALNVCFDCALKQLSDTRRRLAEVEKERDDAKAENDLFRLNEERSQGYMLGAWYTIRDRRQSIEGKGHMCDYRKCCDSLFDQLDDELKRRPAEINPWGRIHREVIALRAKLTALRNAADGVVSELSGVYEKIKAFQIKRRSTADAMGVSIIDYERAQERIKAYAALMEGAGKEL